jgi:hypothetical protein
MDVSTLPGSMSHPDARMVALGASVTASSEETLRKASLFVASQAKDAADCRELLGMLGLIDVPVRSSKSVRQQARKGKS